MVGNKGRLVDIAQGEIVADQENTPEAPLLEAISRAYQEQAEADGR